MGERRVLVIAPLAIFPVALVFVMVRSLLIGDLRELIAAPFSALMITAVGYPVAVVVCWLLVRAIPRLVNASLGVALCVGVASAEAAFWLLIHPIWQREFSNSFCVALVAACGLATAGVFHVVSRTRPKF
ncbi:MAG: hypothetical protein PHO08_20110 [Methylococcales bacterium]|nr:hypothetical protein [Methylococcales bacterium]MDD5632094.1 hypothetical protein [Methylococcales bacterium]